MAYLSPVWNAKTKLFDWSRDLYVKACPDVRKGNGLFAARRLEKGSVIPYHGRLCQTFSDGTYVCRIKRDLYIDAHPVHHKAGQGLFIGAFINEPNPGEKANARLSLCRWSRPHPKTGAYAHVVLTRTIEPHTEVLYRYGTSYKRDHYPRA